MTDDERQATLIGIGQAKGGVWSFEQMRWSKPPLTQERLVALVQAFMGAK